MRPAAGALAAAVLAASPVAEAAEPLVAAPVLVSPNRTPVAAARSGSAVSVLTEEDLTRDGDLSLDDALQRLPGVTFTRNGPPGAQNSVTVRGLPGRYLQVRVDGIELADPAGPQGGALLNTLTPFDIGRVELLRGSQSALYGGEAVSGVLDLTTRRARQDGLAADLRLEGGSFGTAVAALSVTGGYDKGEFALNASGLDTDGFSAADENAGNTEADASRIVTLSGSGAWELSPGLEIGGAFRYADVENEFDQFVFGAGIVDGSRDQVAEVTTLAGRAYVRAEIMGVENEFSVQRFESNRDSTDAGVDSRFDGDRTKLEWLAETPLGAMAGLQLGADWTRESLDTDDGFGALQENASEIAGAFAQVTLDPVESLTVTGAVRHDEHTEFGGFTTGRATVAYRPLEGTKLRASLANGFRAPTNFELFAPGFGNAALDPETSVSADAGIEQTFWDGRARLGAGLFWIETDDPIVFDLATFTYQQGNISTTSQGVELEGAVRPLEGVEIALNYTYTDASDDNGNPVPFTADHQIGATARWQATDRLGLGATATYVTGLQNLGVSEETYLLLNARADWRLTDTATLYVRAENLLDQEYQTVDGYGTPDLSAYAGVALRF
jgi:vitamin B12 transporter